MILFCFIFSILMWLLCWVLNQSVNGFVIGFSIFAMIFGLLLIGYIPSFIAEQRKVTSESIIKTFNTFLMFPVFLYGVFCALSFETFVFGSVLAGIGIFYFGFIGFFFWGILFCCACCGETNKHKIVICYRDEDGNLIVEKNIK